MQPLLSVIVNFHNMEREAARTLFTLSAGYQQRVALAEYEVIVIDNGSRQPLDPGMVRGFGSNFRLVTHARGRASPAAAINAAVRGSAGQAVAVCIDGARMLSPGVIHMTLAALRAFPDSVVATLAWHLGHKLQNLALMDGYNQVVEDRLLETVDWRGDGYELFKVSCLAASSDRGWFLPINESNCLTMRRENFERLAGLEEGFETEGGGFVALDFYRRACETLGELVLLLGEGTFHQFHGGVATNVKPEDHPGPRFGKEYRRIRGCDFAPPTTEAYLLGSVPRQCLGFLKESVEAASVARDTP